MRSPSTCMDPPSLYDACVYLFRSTERNIMIMRLTITYLLQYSTLNRSKTMNKGLNERKDLKGAKKDLTSHVEAEPTTVSYTSLRTVFISR